MSVLGERAWPRAGGRWRHFREGLERNVGDIGDAVRSGVRTTREVLRQPPEGAAITGQPSFTERRGAETPIDSVTVGIVAGAVVIAKATELVIVKAQDTLRKIRGATEGPPDLVCGIRPVIVAAQQVSAPERPISTSSPA